MSENRETREATTRDERRKEYRKYLKEKYGDGRAGEKFRVSEEEFKEGLKRGKELQELQEEQKDK